MTGRLRRAVGPLLVVALAATMSGCNAGGFGSDAPTAQDTSIHGYVALGDGFTAAPDVGDPSHDGCLRSRNLDYPALLAEQLHVDHFRDVSCTGATTAAVTREFRPAKGEPPVPAQVDAIDKDTDLITLGIGIEDRDLLRHLFDVCVKAPCPPGSTGAEAIVNDIDAFAARYTAAVRAIQAKARSAYVVLVGYPRIAPSKAGCAALPHFDQHVSLDAVNFVIEDVNRRIQSTARQTGAGYLDVAGLSAGHELCSKEPWVSGMSDKPGTSVAYHPLAAEQRAVAQLLATQVRNR